MISNINAPEPVLNLAWRLHYSHICLGPLKPGFFSYVYWGAGCSRSIFPSWKWICGQRSGEVSDMAGVAVIFPSYQHLGLGTLYDKGHQNASNHRNAGLEGTSSSHQVQPPVWGRTKWWRSLNHKLLCSDFIPLCGLFFCFWFVFLFFKGLPPPSPQTQAIPFIFKVFLHFLKLEFKLNKVSCLLGWICCAVWSPAPPQSSHNMEY